jgi:hypothetical protein
VNEDEKRESMCVCVKKIKREENVVGKVLEHLK